MKDFKAHAEGINNAWLAGSMFEETDGVAPVDSLKPGVLLIMNDDGRFELLGDTTVSLTNKHLVYYCNSWKDSVSAYGNGMVSAIPITEQFEYEITFDADDDEIEALADLEPGDLLCITDGVFAEATTSGDYVIGSVRSGTATADLGGTITVTTYGGDYAVA